MSSQIQIRQFEYPGDYEAALELWGAMDGWVRVGKSDSPEKTQLKLERDPDLFLVAESESRVIGTVIGAFNGRRGAVYHLAVDPSYRRQGVAARLMDELERRLRAKGCPRCYLFVLEGNENAERFYERQGWKAAPELKLYAKDLDE